MLAHVRGRLAPQCSALIVGANGDPARLASFGLPVVADELPGFPGPLAGVLAGLACSRQLSPDVDWVVSAAVDTPFLPSDLVARLHEARARDDADLAVAASGGRRHHVVALWRTDFADDLRYALAHEGLRAVAAFTDRYRVAEVAWPAEPSDPFFNINTAEDLARAEALARCIAGSNEAGVSSRNAPDGGS